MPFSVRLDDETEALLNKTARAMSTTKSEILKASIHDFCKKTLQDKKKKPYELISDLIGGEFSGKGDLAMNSEEILRKVYQKNHDPSLYTGPQRFPNIQAGSY